MSAARSVSPCGYTGRVKHRPWATAIHGRFYALLMDARPAGDRDYAPESSEVASAYRVTLWERPARPPDADRPQIGWSAYPSADCARGTRRPLVVGRAAGGLNGQRFRPRCSLRLSLSACLLRRSALRWRSPSAHGGHITVGACDRYTAQSPLSPPNKGWPGVAAARPCRPAAYSY